MNGTTIKTIKTAHPAWNVTAAQWLRDGVNTDAVCISTTKNTKRRLVLHRWSDTGACTLRDIEGDGRKLDFVEHSNTDLGVLSLDEAVAMLEASC